MQKLQPVRGTSDLTFEQAQKYQHVIESFVDIAKNTSFDFIKTPIFEFTEVFSRTMGETSDVVNKEMYTFTDRSDNSITLRPEFTAGLVRSFISNGMQQNLPCKFYTHGPVFRYERPQKGRQRQFHQLDAEVFGITSHMAEIELILMAIKLFDTLDIAQDIELQINTLGDANSRAAYNKALVEYYTKHQEQLSDDSKTRLAKNPLRILDSKDESDKAINQNAPKLHDYLNQESQQFFSNLTNALDELDIKYTINQNLVRGLDYYTHTVFEFVTNSLGAQGTVLAGGRYDGLVKQMGGQDTPAVGWGAGIERLMLMLDKDITNTPPIVIVADSEALAGKAMQIADDLIDNNIKVSFCYNYGIKKGLKFANKQNAQKLIILAENEYNTGQVILKDLANNNQQLVDLDKVTSCVNA